MRGSTGGGFLLQFQSEVHIFPSFATIRYEVLFSSILVIVSLHLLRVKAVGANPGLGEDYGAQAEIY